MLRSLLICAAAIAAAGCATTAPQHNGQTAATTAPGVCSLETGSRIKRDPAQCSMTPGRAYNRDDIDRTGQIDVADALRLLDPTITVHH